MTALHEDAAVIVLFVINILVLFLFVLSIFLFFDLSTLSDNVMVLHQEHGCKLQEDKIIWLWIKFAISVPFQW